MNAEIMPEHKPPFRGKDFMSFAGYLTIKEFWIGFVAITFSQVVMELARADGGFLGIAALIALIGLSVAWLGLFKARLNDAGWSGWWAFFPFLNIIVAGFFETKEEDNRFKGNIEILNKKTSRLEHLLYGFLLSILMAVIYSFDTFYYPSSVEWIVRMLGAAIGIFIISCIGLLFRKPIVFYILIIALPLMGILGKTVV